MSRSARSPTQLDETAMFTQLVVFPSGPQQTSLPSLVFHILLKLLFYIFLKIICLTWYLLILFFEACWVLHDKSKVAKVKLVPSCSANLCAFFASEENPFSHAFSSNIHTLLIIGSGFSRKRKLSVLTMARLPSLISGGIGLRILYARGLQKVRRGAR